MIAKSDIIILTLASALLLMAVLRSQPASETSPQRAVRAQLETRPVAAASRAAKIPTTTEPTRHSDPSVVIGSATQVPTAAQVPTATPVPTATQVPTVTNTPSSTFREPEIIQEASFRTHEVRAGDSLSRLAQRYNTSVSELRSLNNLSSNTIYIGQKLVYPSP